jgi:holliday junction DNA helicase RuvA
MIARLRGQIVRKSVQDALIDVGGVGYRVIIPLSTFYRLGADGELATLLIHTHVREDALSLFGFLTGDEQFLFERLISVSGVGPKLAINILSGIDAAELRAALRGSDVARLTRVPGVGKKTAERLVLELKDKLPAIDTATTEDLPTASGSIKDDLLSALANLGYSRPEAERSIDRAVRAAEGAPFEDLLRRTLQILSGR